MKGPVINSAALYFRPQEGGIVPFSWFERVRSGFFDPHHLPIDDFGVWAEGFSEEQAYSFDQNELGLICGLKEGRVRRLGLYNKLSASADASQWRAMASLDMVFDMSFFGLDERILPQAGPMLLRTYEICRDVPGIGYGIAYKQFLSKGPECYAAGVGFSSSLADFSEILTDSPDHARRRAWLNEMEGARRYLTGRFRGAYPGNILSGAHMDGLRDKCPRRIVWPGSFSQIDEDLWLWEVPEAEIPRAEAMLNDADLLIK